MRKKSTVGLILAVAVILVFASQAMASTWNFSWSGWVGGDHDSNTWSASGAGTHTWWKTSCAPHVGSLTGITFTVEVRRVRSFAPDVSLGTHGYNCNNTDGSTNYSSSAGGPHKFRFPNVSNGSMGGIDGTGHVNFP
jgi:hypothetical protein